MRTLKQMIESEALDSFVQAWARLLRGGVCIRRKNWLRWLHIESRGDCYGIIEIWPSGYTRDYEPTKEDLTACDYEVETTYNQDEVPTSPAVEVTWVAR